MRFRASSHFASREGRSGSAACGASGRLGGGKPCAGIKPARQQRPARQVRGLLRQVNEHALGDILGGGLVAMHLAQGGRINQRHMTAHQFGEGILGTGFDVLAQQLAIVCHRLSPLYTRPTKNRTKNVGLLGSLNLSLRPDLENNAAIACPITGHPQEAEASPLCRLRCCRQHKLPANQTHDRPAHG
jgi:hypothetical protein